MPQGVEGQKLVRYFDSNLHPILKAVTPKDDEELELALVQVGAFYNEWLKREHARRLEKPQQLNPVSLSCQTARSSRESR